MKVYKSWVINSVRSVMYNPHKERISINVKEILDKAPKANIIEFQLKGRINPL